jgi:hypothetical protein
MNVDQYGRPIPKDLFTIPDLRELESEDIERILRTKWWKCRDVLFISEKLSGTKHFSGYSPTLMFGLTMQFQHDALNFEYVDDVLHRYSDEDGFYHA